MTQPQLPPWSGEDLNREKEPSPMTQKDKMLLAFTAYGTVCGTTFLEMHIPRYAARIGDLKDNGYNIDRVKCPYRHHTHGKQIASYRLTPNDEG